MFDNRVCRVRTTHARQLVDQRVRPGQFIERTCACRFFGRAFSERLLISILEVLDQLRDNLLAPCGISWKRAKGPSDVVDPLRHVPGS